MKQLMIAFLFFLIGCSEPKFKDTSTKIQNWPNAKTIPTNSDIFFGAIEIELDSALNGVLFDSLVQEESEGYNFWRKVYLVDTSSFYGRKGGYLDSEFIKDSIEFAIMDSADYVQQVLLPREIRRIKNQYLFDQFANQPYFDSKNSKDTCINENMVKERYQKLMDSLSSYFPEIETQQIQSSLIKSSSRTKSTPIGVFMISSNDIAKWVVIYSWESKLLIPQEEQKVSDKEKCVSHDHISGVLWDFHLTKREGHFSCL